MSVRWMRSLAASLAERLSEKNTAPSMKEPRLFWPGIVPRNLLFLAIVLVHALRRLLPPY
jgi:hypothetical protein